MGYSSLWVMQDLYIICFGSLAASITRRFQSFTAIHLGSNVLPGREDPVQHLLGLLGVSDIQLNCTP